MEDDLFYGGVKIWKKMILKEDSNGNKRINICKIYYFGR